MRYILGLCLVLAVANLTGMVERASAFQAAGRPAVPSPAQGAATAAENAVQQNLLPDSTTTQSTATSPANANQVPAVPGTVTANQVPAVPGTVTATPPTIPAPPTVITAPTNPIQTPSVPGTVTTNPATGTATIQGNVVPGTNNAGMSTTRAYSLNNPAANQPAITPGTATATTPGMTMAPGTYYQGTAVGAYGLTPTSTYSSMYVTPGYATPGQVYYATPTQPYEVRQRRGLFGGLFRRNRQVYTTVPSNYMYTYNPAQGVYTYAPAAN